jgi:hypothetical protein
LDDTPSSHHAQRDAIRVALFISIALITMACGSADQRSPNDGTLTDAAYENTYFGFTLPLPTGWSVATPQTEAHLIEVGRRTLADADELLQAGIEAASAKSFQLLTVSEHPVGAPVPFNPMIIVAAESVAHAPGVKTGADYLFHLRGVLESSSVPYEPRGEIVAFDLGGRPFHRRDFEVSPPSGITQSYIFAREGDYALGFILTARDQSELEHLLGLVSKVHFR